MHDSIRTDTSRLDEPDIGNTPTLHMLWLIPFVPIPSFGGGSRVFNLLRSLAPTWDIDALVIGSASDPALDRLQVLCRHIEVVPAVEHSGWRRRLWQLRALLSKHSLFYWIYFNAQVEDALKRMLDRNTYDVVIVEQVFMGYYTLPTPAPIVLDQQNVESTLMLMASRNERTLLRRLFNTLEYRKFLPDEQRICRDVNLILTTSLVDRRAIERWGGIPPVAVVPNGVDSDSFAPSAFAHIKPSDTKVLFTGSMHYAPNAEAMFFFCERIWPRVQAQVPDAQLQIVGGNPSPAVRRLGQLPGVEVIGYVDDLRPYIAEAAVAIAPLRIGSGTRLKILEAMSMSRAVVSTTLGCEGLAVVNGEHLLVADEPDAFADYVATLLRNPERRAALGQAARRLVETYYDWNSIGKELDRTLRSLVVAV
jgi:sugar transferase (PEP-CTERM/EpsH1 system associated)